MASKQTNLDKVNLHDTPSQADVYAAKSQADTKPSWRLRGKKPRTAATSGSKGVTTPRATGLEL
jgi:hypothetical protein